MKQIFAIALLQIILVFSVSASPPLLHGVGNGGDFVRAHFIKKGTQIRNFLANTEKGQEFAAEFNLRVYSFDSVLNTRVIVLSETQLYDNFGQPVDAIFDNGQIQLYAATWRDFLNSDTEAYMMIFHEMLRATNHYDDDFIISKHLKLEVSDQEIEEQPDVPIASVSCICRNVGQRVKLTCLAKNKVNDEVASEVGSFRTWSQCHMEKVMVLEEYGQDSGALRVNIDRYDMNASHSGSIRKIVAYATSKNVSFGFDDSGGFFDRYAIFYPSGARQALYKFEYDELQRSLSFLDLGQSINLIILDGTYIGFEVVD